MWFMQNMTIAVKKGYIFWTIGLVEKVIHNICGIERADCKGFCVNEIKLYILIHKLSTKCG